MRARKLTVVLDGYPAKFPPGQRFSYCDSGYVVLALLAERVSGTPFHDLVRQRICEPAGMHDTQFLRSDELPGHAALGYLATDGWRTNVSSPVRGSGDGGVYSTAADIHAMWAALFAGRIVSTDWVAEIVRPRSDVPAESMRYGLGFWLHQSREAVILEVYDAGCRSGASTIQSGGHLHGTDSGDALDVGPPSYKKVERTPSRVVPSTGEHERPDAVVPQRAPLSRS